MIDEPHADSTTAGKGTAERVARADTHVPTPRAAGGRRLSRCGTAQPSRVGGDVARSDGGSRRWRAAAVGALVTVAVLLLFGIVAMERRSAR